ncbi:LysM peptidoglycan-binding domain-containing protein [Pseudomonas sp. CGJS7]|uniref:LysM peptidoglycan-binding domain-containing protein n=1 Tax=Pseudomonas sp. CGJS7 TaxID=3109348 RepID=UPI00300A7BD4
MTTLNGPSYAGPSLGALVNTKAEIETAQVATPTGMKPVVVEPGDNLSRIAAENGMTLPQLLAVNPQFSMDPAGHPNTRSADLIYPGEVIFVSGDKAKATDAAAEKYDATLEQGHAPESAPATSAKAEFTNTVKAEIDAGIVLPPNSNREGHSKQALAVGEKIAQRYEAQGEPELAKAAREAAQARAKEISDTD